MKIYTIFFVLLFSLILSLSCSKSKSNKQSSHDQPTEKKAENIENVYRITSDKTSTLNPHDYQLFVERGVMKLIYSSLLQAIVDPETKKLSFIPFDAEELPKRNDEGTV